MVRVRVRVRVRGRGRGRGKGRIRFRVRVRGHLAGRTLEVAQRLENQARCRLRPITAALVLAYVRVRVGSRARANQT